MLFTSDRPVAVQEKKRMYLDCATTGIDKPADIALRVLPIAITPLIAGNETLAPDTGTNKLPVPLLLYNCALITTDVPTKDNAAVFEKNAVIDFIVPFLGTLKPKLILIPAPPVRSILPALSPTPENALPKPIKDPKPTKPPVTVVNVTGTLDA